METIFYPGCRIKAGYGESSEKLKQYLQEKYGITPTGCCKEYYKEIKEDSRVLLICNNCSVELESLADIQNLQFVYELIDQDETFSFPDYHGKKLLIQDCFYGYRDHPIDQTVRSLLLKMNIEAVEKVEPVQKEMSRSEHRKLIEINASKTKQNEVITYCAICNLAYKKANKDPHFLLDLLFGGR